MKRLIAMLLALVLVLGLAACGSTAQKEDPAPSTSTTETPAAETETEAAPEAPAEAETPASKGTLTIYSPQADADRGPWIEEQAEAALGFDVEFLCATGGDLAERLRAEKNNPQADVIMGLVQTAMYQLEDEGLLAQYTPSWAEGLPEAYKDPNGYFYSFWQTPIIIGYNPDYVTNPPASWLDLIKDEYAGLYAVGKTSSQTVRSYIIGMMWPYYDEATGDISEEGWELLRTFYANAYSLPTDSDSWQLFKDGTLPIVLNWFGGAKNKAAAYEAPIAYVTPAEGTPVVAEGIAVVAGTDQEEMAQAFIEWWGSPENMAAYANEFGQAPAHPDAIAMCDDSVRADAEMFTAQLIDWQVCSRKMDDWFVKIELEIMP